LRFISASSKVWRCHRLRDFDSQNLGNAQILRAAALLNVGHYHASHNSINSTHLAASTGAEVTLTDGLGMMDGMAKTSKMRIKAKRDATH
jgi:hypothetical protein